MPAQLRGLKLVAARQSACLSIRPGHCNATRSLGCPGLTLRMDHTGGAGSVSLSQADGEQDLLPPPSGWKQSP